MSSAVWCDDGTRKRCGRAGGLDKFMVRVPLLCCGEFGRSLPGPTLLRTTVAASASPTNPARCPDRRSPPESTERRSCPHAPKTAAPDPWPDHARGTDRVVASPGRASAPTNPSGAAPVPDGLVHAGRRSPHAAALAAPTALLH